MAIYARLISPQMKEESITIPFETTPAAVFLRRQTELLAHKKIQRPIAHEAEFASRLCNQRLKVISARVDVTLCGAGTEGRSSA